MKLYAALVFSFCMGLHGNSQTTNKAEVDYAGTQRIADASCDTAERDAPGSSRKIPCVVVMVVRRVVEFCDALNFNC